ncbi:MAG: carboxypeptidase-like regulatory domain-containing protein [Terracidiphilus sp.]
MKKKQVTHEEERLTAVKGSERAVSRIATRILGAISIFAMLVLLPAATQAQLLYGTLVGNVTDQTGAAVVGATVAATDAGTGISHNATTDGNGIYRINDLDAGTYTVAISAKSFAGATGKGILIEANVERRFDVQLRPAAVGQTVTVTTAPPELQTDNATVANELESAQVQNLLTTAGYNMRNFQSLFQVLPGFSPPGEQHSEAGNPGDTYDVQRQWRVGQQ